jgi:hypothetical protein
MSSVERRISVRGPRFWMDGDELMFCFQYDSSTRDGPRPATDKDRLNFDEAYAAFIEGSDDKLMGPPVSITKVDPEAIPAAAPKPHAGRREAARQRGATA